MAIGLQTVLEGKPTGPQVKAIVEHVQTCNHGDVIPYAKLVELAEAKHKTTRFRTVMQAARKHILDALHVEGRCRDQSGI